LLSILAIRTLGRRPVTLFASRSRLPIFIPRTRKLRTIALGTIPLDRPPLALAKALARSRALTPAAGPPIRLPLAERFAWSSTLSTRLTERPFATILSRRPRRTRTIKLANSLSAHNRAQSSCRSNGCNLSGVNHRLGRNHLGKLRQRTRNIKQRLPI
jgi:hypothetical protein